MVCWPIDRRNPPKAKLHAKAVIIDSHDVLVTSVNMTSAAYDRTSSSASCAGGVVSPARYSVTSMPSSLVGSWFSCRDRVVDGASARWAAWKQALDAPCTPMSYKGLGRRAGATR